MNRRDSFHRELGRQMRVGNEATSFFGSIMGGFVLGLLLDTWIGTRPVFIVAGIVVGSVSGFLRMWQLAKKIDEPSRRS